jgi:mannitol/fructose-specific phosphotransferase system IIA component (Ntr-type)
VLVLAEYLDKKKIMLDLNAHDLRQVLVQMLSLSDEHKHDELLNGLMARESLMSTVLGKGVAVPRIVIDGKEKSEIIIGLSKKGIDMKSLDHIPVKIVILHLLARSDDYASILAQSLRLLNDASLKDDLYACKNQDEIIATIRKWEEE